jgi:hypothetical protein
MALIIGLAIFLLPLGYFGKDYGQEFLDVDSCLDRGGSYDYEKNKCDFNESHPYIPYTERKKALIITCLTLSFGGLFFSIVMRKKIKDTYNNRVNPDAG